MNYPSIRIEGAILSPDILERLEDALGQRPADFNLDASAKVKDDIASAWADAQDYWRIFQRKLETLKVDSPATTETRQQWIVPLLGLLGYQLEYQPKGAELNGKLYNISHRASNRAQAPVQIVGYREPAGLDRKPERSNLRMSAHAIVQEFLNLKEQLYGLVTNGRILRLLRNSSRLIKLSYIEFDLDRIFNDGLFADFAILYRLLHATRLPVTSDTAAESLIERYHQDTIEQGSRIREGLRVAVTEALEILGTGFVAHPENLFLREQIDTGALEHSVFFSHLLRLIYRLLFLNVVEERGLIFPKGTPTEKVRTYFDYYSVQRLRRMARIRGLKTERHHDAWLSLLSTFQIFERPEQAAKLGTTAFGGQLFDPQSLGPLSACRLSNAALLHALDQLCSFDDPKTNQRLPVNFGALATEEFGSVYESLLELHPIVDTAPSPRFGFKQAAGNDRKTSGSYYTPSSLVDCLLDCALEPILNEHIRNYAALGYPSAEAAILSLKVCDPASGSGHFLIAAAQRIARRLALVRAGDEEPSPDVLRHALRQVISHCIYAVDINPMSIELCRVALWLEAVEPGKPLSFLDHHLRVGNSLLGATPELIAAGLPDEIFAAIEGDDKDACGVLRKRNKSEKCGSDLFADQIADTQAHLQQAATVLADLPDDCPEEIIQKAFAFHQNEQTKEFRYKKLLADTWCAAFFCKKVFKPHHDPRYSSKEPLGITQGLLNDLVNDNVSEKDKPSLEEAERLAASYRFFHWHLAFPEVFARGGFDVVLGNPPWDTLSPDRREFFGNWINGLRSMSPDDQQANIDRLLLNESIASAWTKHCRELLSFVHFLKNSGVYKLFAQGNLGKGDFNIYRMFVETALRRVRLGGFAAMIVPGGLYGGANASAIRKHMFNECELRHLYGLINTKRGWFEKVDIDRFAAFAVKRGGRTTNIITHFGLNGPEDLPTPPVEIEAEPIRQLAPDTYAIPDLRNISELATSRKMYAACPAFGTNIPGQPRRHYSREVDMGNDRDLFTTDPAGLPVYEGRMIDNFDHRAKTYQSGHGNSAVWIEREFGDPAKAIVPQWRVLREKIPSKLGDRCDRFRIGFGDVANPRNQRSFTASLIPPGVVCGDKVPTLDFGPDEWFYLPWLAVANSFAMDWLARCRLTSPKMAFSLLDGLPFPRPALTDSLVQNVAPVVLRLVCTGPEMTPFWNRMAILGFVEPVTEGIIPPTAYIKPDTRAKARAQLDAVISARVFNLNVQELADILDTFAALRRHDERLHREFRTKKLIIQEYAQLP